MRKPKHKGRYDKPKPWDEDPNIDHWKVEKFDPSWNEGGMLEVTSFSKLFPEYRVDVPYFFNRSFLSKKLLAKDPARANENWDMYFQNLKSTIDLQLESGEYFLSEKKKSAKQWQGKQAEKASENKRKSDAAFLPPKKRPKEFTKHGIHDGAPAESYLAKPKKRAKKKQ